MRLTDWQKEFRKSADFARTRARLIEQLRESKYRFSVKPEMAHVGHNLEESWGTHYCCHTCSVLGVRY
jgi:hypothetical protein